MGRTRLERRREGSRSARVLLAVPPALADASIIFSRGPTQDFDGSFYRTTRQSRFLPDPFVYVDVQLSVWADSCCYLKPRNNDSRAEFWELRFTASGCSIASRLQFGLWSTNNVNVFL